jgi:hypothetical protein
MDLRLTEKAARQMEQKWALEREAVELLAVIAAEFETDPMSVQCFDLRIVERAKVVTKQLRALPDFL